MADIFSDIAGAVTKPIGGLLSGAARGLFPGAARQADIKVESIQRKKDMEQFGLYMSIMKDQTGAWSEQAKKAAADSMRRSPMFQQIQEKLGGAPVRGKGWGGGMGAGIKGMEATGAKVNPMTGEMEMSYEKPGQFGDIPGAYGLVPEGERAGVARRALEKPATQVSIGEQREVTNTLSLRREFQGDARVKDMRQIDTFTANTISAYNRSLTSKNLGPVDIALAKSFQKLTDIRSTVREGEFATTFEGQKLINKIKGKVQAMLKGGLGFTPEDRKEIRDLVVILQKDSRKMFNQAYDEFSTTADEFGFNKRAIFGGAEKYKLGAEVESPEISDDKISNAISGARKQLGANATEQQILDLAQKIYLGQK